MAMTLDGKLVVAISSRALFDFEAENHLFDQGDDQAYMTLQLQRLDEPASPGVALSLVQKLLRFNTPDHLATGDIGHVGQPVDGDEVVLAGAGETVWR